MARSALLYVGIVGTFAAVIWLLIELGAGMPLRILPPSSLEALAGHTSHPELGSGNWLTLLQSRLSQPIPVLLLQIIVILTVARLFGMIAVRLGQQPVIGEIIAGIFLGPSLLGWVFPGFSAVIFPEESLKGLQALSQFGLIFFMFIIGTELDMGQVRHHSRDAVMISHSSIAWSFFLGVGLAYFTYQTYAPAGITFLSFSLFMGISMSITAFPVLARILRERGLTESPLGVLAITAAATDDLTAWCLLAAIIAIVKAGSIAGALMTFALAMGYVIFMLYVVRLQINKWMSRYLAQNRNPHLLVSGALLVLLLSAYLAEVIGIHALFGAFTAGVVMSEQADLRESLRQKLEDISVLIMLPVFFALTGLRTRIGLLNEGAHWLLCAGITGLAILGKFGGGTLIAKIMGRPWKEALSIGALMNTRGLMELIVLNIGYDLGILSPEIFAMLVIMALVTTFMTGPLLGGINRYFSITPVPPP